ncbi:MAG: DUF3800 domain-containing protein [Candidatus Peribacteria bacterium]|nr:DUF3800 domain-containing protein [Candidatus Peribacteria bacterium]
MIFCLDEKRAINVEICVEKRGKKEDMALLTHYNTVLDQGTYFVNSQRFKEKIEKFSFQSKLHNDIGIQIADLCAYPLISFIRNPDKDNPAFKIIEPKIYINPKTQKQA